MAKAVGANVRRKDGDAKVTGAAKYIDDLTFPGMLFGATIRTTIPKGEIKSHRVDLKPDFIVADYKDIPGRNIVALIDDDQPCLVEKQIRHVAEPVLLVAHPDRHALIGVEKRVSFDYRQQAPLYDPEKSPICFKEITIDKGDIASGFRHAHTIVEGEYRSGHQEQLYIEPTRRDRGASGGG